MNFLLIREKPDGKAVRGKLYRNGIVLCSTLENLDYLIPALIYPLSVTYSPKFKRHMPLVCNVPRTTPTPLRGEEKASAEWRASHVDVKNYRSGIRFHPGNKPEHSRGCILVSREAEEMLKKLILSEKETRIEIN